MIQVVGLLKRDSDISKNKVLYMMNVTTLVYLSLFIFSLFLAMLSISPRVVAKSIEGVAGGNVVLSLDFAKNHVAKVANDILSIIGDPTLSKAAKEKKIADFFDDNFDVDGVSRFVLGIYVRGATEAEFEEFKAAFKEYIIKSYLKKSSISSEQKKVLVTGGTPVGNDRFIIYSEVLSRNPSVPTVLADWEVVKKDGKFLISDIRFEGVSLKLNQRNEYMSLLEGVYSRSVAKLTKAIKRLNKRG